jgi:Tfp pilus assembly protein PilV
MLIAILARQDGFTFNEILAALGIAVVTVMGYSLSSVQLIQRHTTSSNSTIAIHLAQDKLEELQSRKNIADVDLCPGAGDHALSANPATPGIFHRCWRVAPSALGVGLKQLDVIVSWRDTEPREITLSTLIYVGDGA